MKITKFGHCCLLIELDGVKLLTDPGHWSHGFEAAADIDLILISHEHADHLHLESLKTVLQNNPSAEVIANQAVGNILEKENISHTTLDGRSQLERKGITIEAFDGRHAEIYEDFGQVQNTGYLIGGKLFYPGDSYVEPEKEVDVLALPVAGPWCRSVDALSYAIRVKPKKAFPVHDAVLGAEGLKLTHSLFEMILKNHDIEFVSLQAVESKDF